MFDIAFSEIVVIAVVALVVLGPEKLPKTARTLGHLYGRLRRYVSEVQADITREMELDELRKLRQQVESSARDLETTVNSAVRDVETNVRSLESELNDTARLGEPDNAAAAATPEFPTEAGTALAPSETASGAAFGPAVNAETEPPRQSTLPGLDRR